LTALLAYLVCVQDAHAYIDPGQGSYLFQMVVAGFLGVLFTIRVYWSKIKSYIAKFLSRKRK
jgi:hypothetical protein